MVYIPVWHKNNHCSSESEYAQIRVICQQNCLWNIYFASHYGLKIQLVDLEYAEIKNDYST